MGVSSGGVSNYVNTSSGIATGVCADNGVSGGGVFVGFEFTPAALFASGSVGFWHDYTDPTTWFQDTAGSTPATALGDPVGRVNDKSGNGITGLQATSAARPTYGRMPFGGVRNQFTYSEDFTNAVWSKTRVTLTGDSLYETATVGSHNLQQGSKSVTSGTTQTIEFSLAKGVGTTAPDIVQITFASDGHGLSQYANFNLTTSQVTFSTGGTATITAEESGWQKCTWTAVATATTALSAGLLIMCNNDPNAARAPSYLGVVTSDVRVRRAQYQSGALSAYQKVVQAYDVTESGVASVDCLWFDGVDDHLVLTAAGADLARNTGRFTAFGGVNFTKSIATNLLPIFLASSGAAASNVRVRIAGDTSALQLGARRLDADTVLIMDGATVQVTFSNTIVAGVFDYTNADFFLRKDGAVIATDTTTLTDGSTSDTASLVVYIGRSSSSYFGGFMTGVITVKATTLSESQLLQTEQYLGNQIGVTI